MVCSPLPQEVSIGGGNFDVDSVEMGWVNRAIMKVLVIGSGGREHALAWKIASSKKVRKVYVAPGNGGTAEIAENVGIAVDNISALATYAAKEGIDLTIVGPELPLACGIVDEFERKGLAIFGPTRRASILEWSKAYTKRFCTEYKIPTAAYSIFSKFDEAMDYISNCALPVVVKADGLAAGKGVVICRSRHEAEAALESMLKKGEFGDAGANVVIEEFLEGEEVSFIVVSDGTNFVPLETARDHKRVYDGDLGPNTGGMGAYSPFPLEDSLKKRIENEIIIPTLYGMKSEGREFLGFLYAGLMISGGKPYLLEYNVRCGDPETQAILVRMNSDIVDLFEYTISGHLNEYQIEWDKRTSVCVVMASRGYPGHYEVGKEITGLDTASLIDGVTIFHSGTKKEGGRWFTNGGRVLSVTALGKDREEAIERAYSAVDMISWEGEHHRRDIGRSGLR